MNGLEHRLALKSSEGREGERGEEGVSVEIEQWTAALLHYTLYYSVTLTLCCTTLKPSSTRLRTAYSTPLLHSLSCKLQA